MGHWEISGLTPSVSIPDCILAVLTGTLVNCNFDCNNIFLYRYVQSWIEKREVQSEKANLTILFERYVPILIDTNRSGRFKKITPIQEVI